MITDTVYDAQGRAQYQDDPHFAGEPTDGILTIYDQNGNVTGTERYANMVLTLYTGANPPTSQETSVGALLSSTSTTYDALGRAVSSTDAAGLVTNTTYDSAGNAVEMDQVYGGVTHTSKSTYDVLGRAISRTNALGRTTYYRYNATGEVTKTTFADGTSIADTYDSQGRKTSETDQNGLTTSYGYDPSGPLITVVLPPMFNPTTGIFDKPTYVYVYDRYGNQTSSTDPLGRTTTFAYDAFGNEIAHALPLGQSESWHYNALGQMTSHTDFDSNVTSYDQYDVLGRLTRKSVYASTNLTTPAWTVKYAYNVNLDAAGDYHDTVTVSTGGSTDGEYDVHGNLVRIRTPQGTINYQYDLATRQKIGESTTNTAISYAYNGFGELSTVTARQLNGQGLAQPLVTGYSYDTVGNLFTTQLPNGTTETRTYDSLNRLTSVVTSGASGTIAGFAYTYDPAGHVTSETAASGRKVTYTYDDLGRLVEEAIADPTAGNRTFDYTYDVASDRLTKTDTGAPPNQQLLAFVYDSNDRMQSVTGSSGYAQVYAYDPKGNTLTVTGSGGAPSASYTWDVAGRLISATTGGITMTYTYDDDGNRLSSAAGAATTTYLNDSNQVYDEVLEEYTLGGVLAATYVRGLDLLFQDRSGVRSFYTVDQLGSTRALTNMSGAVTDTYAYDSFGELIGSTGTTTNEYEYAGYQTDATTGEDYLQARYYDPAAGRFTARDSFDGTISDPITLNHYVYAVADPVDGTDPSGHRVVPGYARFVGTFVQNYLSRQFEAPGGTPIRNRWGNRWVSTIAKDITGLPVPPNKRKPDAAEYYQGTNTGDVYEFKHVPADDVGNAFAIVAGLLNARFNRPDYEGALDAAVPGSVWGQGVTWMNGVHDWGPIDFVDPRITGLTDPGDHLITFADYALLGGALVWASVSPDSTVNTPSGAVETLVNLALATTFAGELINDYAKVSAVAWRAKYLARVDVVAAESAEVGSGEAIATLDAELGAP
jgi:RHS repeat-associated protein